MSELKKVLDDFMEVRVERGVMKFLRDSNRRDLEPKDFFAKVSEETTAPGVLAK